MDTHDPGYTLTNFGHMVLNQPRVDAYLAAMAKLIKPGDLVLEIGAGPGVFAMLAARMGARQVIAIECNPSIRLAKRLVQHNQMQDRVRCIEGVSTELRLDTPADVIISDLRSVLPLYGQHIPSIVDARERLLAPGGVLIGCRDTLFSAPVEHSAEYRRITEPWRVNQFGLDLSAAAEFETNRWSKIGLRPEQLLSEAQHWLSIDYRSITQPSAHGTLSWEIKRAGLLHGLATWFDAELAPGVGFSNHPAKPELIYGQAFMPLPHAVEVRPGFRVEAQIHAHWVNRSYVWQWKGEVREERGTTICGFDQSSFGKRLQASPD